MRSELVVLLGERVMGRLQRDRHGRLSFVYDEGWQALPSAHPLSLSMPLARREHQHDVVSAFLWGLLPDNPLISKRWARRLDVAAGDPCALLAHVGDDCAGAVRFVTPERLTRTGAEAHAGIDWLDEAEIAARLRLLRKDVSAWRRPGDAARFCLAGEQAKTALYCEGERFGVPCAGWPTTHLLKPGLRGLDSHAENEHFCLDLARAAGLPTAASRVMQFEDQTAIVVERFDRLRRGDRVLRVHQEDFVQALALEPSGRYANEDGPGVAAIAGVLRQHSRQPEEDVGSFVRAVAFAFLIGASGAHAKNYSLLFGAQGWVRLAPLYDLASGLPYRDPQKLKLAMRIGGKYRLRNIGVRQWRKLARELTLEPDEVSGMVTGLAWALPEHAADTLRRCRRAGLHHSVLKRLVAAIGERCEAWLRVLCGA